MSDPIAKDPTAALAPEEWAKLEIDDGNARYDATFSHRLYIKPHGGDSFEARERHALAALCLYEQPFGFTHADVVNLRAHALDTFQRTGWTDHWADRLAAKIAALLPEEPR